MDVLAKLCCEHMDWWQSLPLDENETMVCGREGAQEKMGYLHCENSACLLCLDAPRMFWGLLHVVHNTLDRLLVQSETLKTSQVSHNLCICRELISDEKEGWHLTQLC